MLVVQWMWSPPTWNFSVGNSGMCGRLAEMNPFSSSKFHWACMSSAREKFTSGTLISAVGKVVFADLYILCRFLIAVSLTFWSLLLIPNDRITLVTPLSVLALSRRLAACRNFAPG